MHVLLVICQLAHLQLPAPYKGLVFLWRLNGVIIWRLVTQRRFCPCICKIWDWGGNLRERALKQTCACPGKVETRFLRLARILAKQCFWLYVSFKQLNTHCLWIFPMFIGFYVQTYGVLQESSSWKIVGCIALMYLTPLYTAFDVQQNFFLIAW